MNTPAIHIGPRRIGIWPYESPCDGIGDDADALRRAILDITADNLNVKNWQIELPSTLVIRQSLPVMDRHMIIGQGALASVVLKRFDAGVLFNFGGRVGYSGGAVMGIAVPGTSNTWSGYTIIARARGDGYAPDRLRLEDLYLGAGAMAQAAFRHIELIGSARSSPMGIREPIIRDVTAFGCMSGVPVWLDTIVSGDIDNLSVFPAPYAAPANGQVNVINCIETGFHRLNIDGPLVRSGNAECGFTNKAGAVI